MDQEARSFYKDVWMLALPAGLQMMVESVVGLIDNIMIGSLGEASITAVSVSTTFMWLASVFVMSLANGASILAAQDYGSGNLEKIKRLMSFVLSVGLVVSLGFTGITLLIPDRIIQLYTTMPSAIAPGVAYLRIMAYSIPLMALGNVILLMLRAVRSVKIGLYNSLISCFANMFFNWVFIFGHLGMPRMGVAGAALGTLLTRILQMSIIGIYLLFIEKNLAFRIQDFNPRISRETMQVFIKVTIPILCMELLNNLVVSCQTMITGRVSDSYISANSITHMAWQIPNTFCFGVATAASIMMGNTLGKENFEKAKRDSKRFVTLSLILGTFSAVMVQILLPIFLRFYSITEATKILSRQMGYMASLHVIFIAYSFVVCNGVIKSGGHTKILLYVDLVGSWLVALPLGYITAFVFHWPAYYIYIVLRLGTFVKTFWGMWYLSHGDWMHKIV